MTAETETQFPLVDLGGDDDTPYCYCCLRGTCPHPLKEGHAERAATEFHGTALCLACAQRAPRIGPAMLRTV